MLKYNDAELLLIWLDSIAALCYNEKRAAYGVLCENGGLRQGIKSAIAEREEKLKTVLNDKFTSLKAAMNNDYIKFLLERMDENDVVAITYANKEMYPELLSQTETPPLVLYCKGNIDLLKREKFAIVGSRKSIPLSIEIAKNYTVAVADCDFVPVTGIAEGVDATVLKAAVDNGISAISVFASGLDCIYPASNKGLAESVLKNGLLISEYPLGVSAQRYYFPVRNRIIAGLSRGVLIVSGGERSGTIYTGKYAMEYGRDLFAVPYSVGVATGLAPNTFIKTNAAFLTDDVSDIYRFYNVEEPSDKVEFSVDERAILAALSIGASHVDKIAEKINKSVWEITPVLSLLEIKGAVIKSGANEYSLAHKISEE